MASPFRGCEHAVCSAVPLATVTSFHIGGPAEHLVEPHNLDELINEHTKELSILLDTSTKTSQTVDLGTILKLLSEMLIRSFSYHTYCRIAIMDRSKQYFEIKNSSHILFALCAKTSYSL